MAMHGHCRSGMLGLTHAHHAYQRHPAGPARYTSGMQHRNCATRRNDRSASDNQVTYVLKEDASATSAAGFHPHASACHEQTILQTLKVALPRTGQQLRQVRNLHMKPQASFGYGALWRQCCRQVATTDAVRSMGPIVSRANQKSDLKHQNQTIAERVRRCQTTPTV